jgi:ribosomal-protein-alanine N-acetyltransferase
MDEQFIGRGIASEAVKLVTTFGFEQLRLHRIEAYVSPDNVGSLRVLEKAGFQKEGLLKRFLFINGEWKDHYYYALLEDDF